MADPRTGLWSEFARLIRECQSRVVLIENVTALRSRGLDRVLDDLYRADYRAWFDCVPAMAVGAPHRRDRVWVTAVRQEEMPDLGGKVIRSLKLAKSGCASFPRAGAMTDRGFVELKPQATIKACKAALGEGRALFPTPSTVSYGSNCGAAAGRVGPIRHSLESMARHGLWPADRGGRGDLLQAVNGNDSPSRHFSTPLWPTPSSRDHKDAGMHSGRMGRGQLPEAVRDSLRRNDGGERPEPPVFPTATATAADSRNSRNATAGRSPGSTAHAGTTLSDHVRMWPSPTAATAAQASGRQGRDGGPNLRTAVNEEAGAGPLNPEWCAWLMGTPLGWLDLECDEPVQLDWSSEHGIPRVLADVPQRKDKLMALGNSLVHQVAYLRIIDAHEKLGIS